MTNSTTAHLSGIGDRPKNKLDVYVFSFNRPQFLRNCLLSLGRHLSLAQITVVDDNSSPALIAPLEDRFPQITFVKSADLRSETTAGRHGALYDNMNWAICDAKAKQAAYALFLQEDMQLVREVTKDDLVAIDEFFAANTKSYGLSPCFLKGMHSLRDGLEMQLDVSRNAFLRESQLGGRNAFFSDVSIFHVDRTLADHGMFSQSEADNEAQARARKAFLGFMRRPFAMWLPFPTSYRYRRRAFGSWFCDTISGAGFFPICDMTSDQVQQLFAASERELPIAEKYLLSPRAPTGDFWPGGGAYNTSARGGWRRLLGRLVSTLAST